MAFKAFLSCLFVVAGAVFMVPLMFSAWLYHIDPDGIRGWVAFGVASYAWSMFAALCYSVKKWPFIDNEEEKIRGHEDMKRPVTIKVRKAEAAHHFWVVIIGGNGEVMWRTEEYTRIFSAKRAASALFSRMKPGAAKLDLNP